MQRVRIIKNYKGYRKNDVVVMDNNEAFGLIDNGIAVISKDMIPDDYKTLDEEQANGKHFELRSHHSK